MTHVYITIDTEYAAGMVVRRGRDCRKENFSRSIACETPSGPAGIFYQLDTFDRFGLKAVFFVDPMPALLWGVESISDIIGPIVERGHDVQLHLHTEWLAFAEAPTPVEGRTGRNIKDFTFDEQCRLIDFARSTMIAAGAPPPIAFRAGNYGANDDTLLALKALGIRYDTSHCAGIAGGDCEISLGPDELQPVRHCGIIEVPIGSIRSIRGKLRHAQITALSSREILAAIRHARGAAHDSFSLVSHSFELVSRDRSKTNQIVKRRFERLCAELAEMDGVQTATYSARPPALPLAPKQGAVLPHNPMRTAFRMLEQAAANALYGSG